MALISMNTVEGYDNCPTIYLNDDQCEALGLTSPPAAGSSVMLMCKAVFQSVTESVEDDGDDAGNDVSVSIKITDMELSAAPTSSIGGLYD